MNNLMHILRNISVYSILRWWIYLCVFLIPTLQGYPKKVDDGLNYVTFVGSDKEWHKTFRKVSVSPGLIHLWMKCVNQEVRGYFFVENVHPHNNQGAFHSQYKFPFYINDKPIQYFQNHGGGGFEYQLESHEDILLMRIDDWTRMTTFSRHECITTDYTDADEKNASSLIMNVYTWEHLDTSLLTPFVLGIVKHMAYHRLALNLTKYQVIIDDIHYHIFLRYSEIASLVESEQLTFLLKGNHPLHHDQQSMVVGEGSHHWQPVYENLLLLQTWRVTATRLLFCDADEFLVFNHQKAYLVQRELLSPNYASIQISRRLETVCTSCTNREGGADVFHSFHNATYHLVNKKMLGKTVINPNYAGIMHTHYNSPPLQKKYQVVALQFVILHFANFYQARHNRKTGIMEGQPIPYWDSLLYYESQLIANGLLEWSY